MSNITHWDPFRDFWGMRSMLDRFYDGSLLPSGTGYFSNSLNIDLDVAETDDAYVVKAQLPGINPEEIEVTYDSNLLTIKGEIREDEEVKKERYHIRERRFGSFSRSITLPFAVKADKIEAKYEAGVLKLTLPKSEEAKPKKIVVQIAPSPKMIEGKASSSPKK